MVVASMVFMSGSVSNSSSPAEGIYPGEMFPDIVLHDTHGKAIRLHDLKGQKVVLNFWASYDAASRATNVALNNVLSATDNDVAFISVSFDDNLHIAQRTMLLDNIAENAHYCETIGAKSDVYKNFDLNNGFKSYFINEDGIIEAMNVSAEQLSELM